MYGAKDFCGEVFPISRVMYGICTGYYNIYEYLRSQRLDSDSRQYANANEWGIDLSEVTNVFDDFSKFKQHILFNIISSSLNNQSRFESFFEDALDDRSDSYRNLTNGWRDEFTLNWPLGGDEIDRMETADWKIITCYYSLFKSVSALLRTKTTERFGSHQEYFNKHAHEFMAELGSSIYTFPLLFFPVEESPYSGQYFTPNVAFPSETRYQADIERENKKQSKMWMERIYGHGMTVSSVDGDTIVTFYDLFKKLREWANYQKGSVLSRFYGETLMKQMDTAMRLISFTGLATSEILLIHAYGWDSFESEYMGYRDACEEGGHSAETLIDERFKIYEKALSNV